LTAAKNAFSQFDKKGEGHIKVNDIAPAMKSMGHNIKGEWLEKMEDEIDTEGQFQYRPQMYW
jgi:Ca2+-binding EF-hand superfamily protein